MADVFISYAREDIEFVRRLHEALANQGRDTWVDWEGIPPRAEWLAEIRTAIDSAAGFVFVISPDSIASQVCAAELQHAAERNKRIIPIVRREAASESMTHELAKLNWIFFREGDPFDTSLEQLLTALDTDLDWVHAHTRLLVRAVEWENHRRNMSYSLRGQDLKDAESWLARAPGNDPQPTRLQTHYVLASRKAAAVRLGITLGAVAIGLMVAAVLSVMAYFQHRERQRQETIAQARKLINRAEALRDARPDQPGAEGDPLIESVRAAVQALQQFRKLGMYSVDADLAVRRGIARLPIPVAGRDIDLGELRAAAFDPTGRFLAIGHTADRILVWDTLPQQAVAAWTEPLPVHAVAVSADGKSAATLTYNASRNVNASIVTVWQVPEVRQRARFELPGRTDALRLSPEGRYLFAGTGGAWTGWDVVRRAKLRLLPDGGQAIYFYDIDFSPDGRQIALAFRRAGTQDRKIRVLEIISGKLTGEWLEPERIAWLKWSQDPQGLLIGTPHGVLLRDPTGGRLRGSFPPAGRMVAFGLNASVAAVLEDNNRLAVRTSSTGRELFRLSGIAAAAFQPGNGRHLVTLNLRQPHLRVWQLGSRWLAEIGPDDPITRVDFSSDSKRLFTSSAAGSRCWRLPAENKALAALQLSGSSAATDNRRPFQAVAGSAGMHHRVDVFNANGKFLYRRDFPLRVTAAAIARDGRRLAVNTGRITRGGWELRLQLWDLDRGKQLASVAYPYRLRDEHAKFLSFTPDDRFVVSESEVGFTLRSADTLEQTAIVYHAAPQAIAFQPAGTLVATLGGDRNIRIWEQAGGTEMARIEESKSVAELALSPDGRWIAALSKNGAARLALLQPADLIAQVCARLRTPCP